MAALIVPRYTPRFWQVLHVVKYHPFPFNAHVSFLFPVSHLQVGGQCQCKFAVAGRQCADCLPGWYGLEASNPSGCIHCNCSDVGTIGISSGFPGCHQDTGQCPCKAHVTGKQTSHKHERKQEYLKAVTSEKTLVMLECLVGYITSGGAGSSVIVSSSSICPSVTISYHIPVMVWVIPHKCGPNVHLHWRKSAEFAAPSHLSHSHGHNIYYLEEFHYIWDNHLFGPKDELNRFWSLRVKDSGTSKFLAIT